MTENKSQILLSVVVPTYNRDHMVKTTIKNYIETDRKDVEFIILDMRRELKN